MYFLNMHGLFLIKNKTGDEEITRAFKINSYMNENLNACSLTKEKNF